MARIMETGCPIGPSLMDQISMVFQRVYLFHDTIAANIRFGRPDASMDEIRLGPVEKVNATLTE